MNQPHKHAEIIKAWADGAIVQFRTSPSSTWCDIEEPLWERKYEYRVKPEPVYPKSSMDYKALDVIYTAAVAIPGNTWHQGFEAIANAVIKQAIIDDDVVINPYKQ